MRLSEAIRLGAMATPQAFATSLDKDGGTCALGAALYAIGHQTRLYTNIADHFNVAGQYAYCPAAGQFAGKYLLVLSIVRILNDEERWTREQIADWVETVEAEQVSSDADASAESVLVLAHTAPK